MRRHVVRVMLGGEGVRGCWDCEGDGEGVRGCWDGGCEGDV